MARLQILGSALASGLFAMMLAAPAQADQWNKLTRLTVHETIQVPGATLPPGKYVMRLMDSPANRHIVQFFNEDQSRLITTVLAIPNQRMLDEITGDTQLSFYETPAGEPPALRAWFYPGDSFGQQFVYSRDEARTIAKRSNQGVWTADNEAFGGLKVRDAKETPKWNETARIYIWGPDDKEMDQQRWMVVERERAKDPKWAETRKTWSRYGVMGPAQPLPGSLQAKSIETTWKVIDKHAEVFKSDFEKALRSSTVKIEERDDLMRVVNQLESAIDELDDNYEANKLDQAHNQLWKVMELAESVNRMMLRSDFGSANNSWALVRSDLNRLAAAHTMPEIRVLVVKPQSDR